MKYLYDIILDGNCIVNSGDLDFHTKKQAKEDAKTYIIEELSKEYEREVDDFEIWVYGNYI